MACGLLNRRSIEFAEHRNFALGLWLYTSTIKDDLLEVISLAQAAASCLRSRHTTALKPRNGSIHPTKYGCLYIALQRRVTNETEDQSTSAKTEKRWLYNDGCVNYELVGMPARHTWTFTQNSLTHRKDPAGCTAYEASWRIQGSANSVSPIIFCINYVQYTCNQPMLFFRFSQIQSISMQK